MESIRAGSNAPGASLARPRLSAEVVAVLYAALPGRQANVDPASSPALIDALSRVSAEAKLQNWPPERLLIAFKGALDMAPAVRSVTPGPDRDEFVARLVSRCIDEYYEDSHR